jgi:SAM-dependent methyltransferase
LPRSDDARRWFDRQAATYDGWDRGPFAFVREREARAVMHALGGVGGRDVLELGCGAGRFTRRLVAGGARVVAVDLSDEMLARVPEERVRRVQGDAATVDVGRVFERVLSAGMLEFVPDPAAVLANAARHAEPGARLVLLVPRTGLLGTAYRLWHRAHGVDVRLFDRIAVRRLVTEAGFRVDDLRRVPPFGFVVVASRRGSGRVIPLAP